MTPTPSIDNILAVYQRSDEKTRIEGKTWYARMREEVFKRADELGIDRVLFTSIVAALSPQTTWELTLEMAARFVTDSSYRPIAYPVHVEKAQRLLDGGDPMGILGQKTGNFFRNLLGSTDNVTVDGHAAAVALGLAGSNEEVHNIYRITKKRYRDIERLYQEAARKAGLQPSELQAIVWLQRRNERKGRNLYGME